MHWGETEGVKHTPATFLFVSRESTSLYSEHRAARLLPVSPTGPCTLTWDRRRLPHPVMWLRFLDDQVIRCVTIVWWLCHPRKTNSLLTVFFCLFYFAKLQLPHLLISQKPFQIFISYLHGYIYPAAKCVGEHDVDPAFDCTARNVWKRKYNSYYSKLKKYLVPHR